MTSRLFTRSRPTAACGFTLLLVVAVAFTGCDDRAEAPEPRSTSAAAASASAVSEMHVFDVKGMHCEGCVMSITAAVKKLPGVQDVEVSLEEERATVRVAEDGADPAAIVAAIDERGYDAALATEPAAATQPAAPH